MISSCSERGGVHCSPYRDVIPGDVVVVVVVVVVVIIPARKNGKTRPRMLNVVLCNNGGQVL
ncbi:hypothetical protein EX30DRAFT_56857 [Ascodesmis nigricans]|uniref:Uncharacterized protein n=1 Tax=Ascodesmis nigricans TaxID=341454 RepID=A0A4S2MUX1_9PEZI|nr:hypothetical protein EX30DRAFT_56857 [Ascodesmis nigricans]